MRALDLLVVAAVVVPAVAGDNTTSELYGPDTYRAERDGLTVVVSTFHASLNSDERYLPFIVAIGSERKTTLTFTPASFSLVDHRGRVVPAADYTALLEGYSKLSFDEAWLESRPLELGLQFSHMARIPSSFYPPTDDGLRTSFVQLTRRTFLADTLYFPRLSGALEGVLTLRVQPREMDRPLEVRVRVPVATVKVDR